MPNHKPPTVQSAIIHVALWDAAAAYCTVKRTSSVATLTIFPVLQMKYGPFIVWGGENDESNYKISKNSIAICIYDLHITVGLIGMDI